MQDWLTPAERRRLTRLERTLARGLGGTLWRCFVAGLLGGAGFAIALRLIAPCFGCQPLTPPSGSEAHPQLEWLLYSMSLHLGRFGAFLLLSSGLFGLVFGMFGFRVWRMARQQHAWLSERASGPGPHDR